MNELSNFSNYSHNITAIHIDNNLLKKEFRNGQIQTKSILWRALSTVQSLFLKGVDAVARTHFFAAKQEARKNELLQQNFAFYSRPQDGVRRVKIIDETNLPLVNQITAQYAKKIGNPQAVNSLHQGIKGWIDNDPKYAILNNGEKEVLEAIYSSGISPESLQLLADHTEFRTRYRLSTAALVLNIYEKVKAYNDSIPSEYWTYVKEEPNGKLSLNLEEMEGGPFTPTDMQKLERFVAAYNLLPQKMIENILGVGARLENNDVLFIPFNKEHANFLNACREANLPLPIPIDKNGTPIPTQQQLELAVKRAYELFEDVPQLSTDQSRAFFARTIQYILLGDRLGYVPYPKDDFCFVYKEIYIPPQESYDFVGQSYTLVQVNGPKREGVSEQEARNLKVKHLVEQFVKDVVRGMSGVRFNTYETVQDKVITKPIDYYKSPPKLRQTLNEFRESFFRKTAEDPNFLGSYQEMRGLLPVTDEAYTQLMQSLANASIPAATMDQLKNIFLEMGEAPGRNPQEVESWRVALLQFFMHAQQGVAPELIKPHYPMTHAINELDESRVPGEQRMLPGVYVHNASLHQRDLVVDITPGKMMGTGLSELRVHVGALRTAHEVQVGTNHEILRRPNVVFATDQSEVKDRMTAMAVFKSSMEIPALPVIGGRPYLKRTGYEQILLPPHAVFYPELFTHLAARKKEAAPDFALQAQGLVNDLNEISNDNLRALSQGPTSWDELKTIMQCLELQARAIPFFNLYETRYKRAKDYIEKSESGEFVIKPQFNPKLWEESNLPPDLYQEIEKTVTVLNQLRPHLHKFRDIRSIAPMLRQPGVFAKLTYLRNAYLEECISKGIPTIVQIEGNEIRPTADQLEVAFALLQREMRGMPKIDSPAGKAFLGRLAQFILAGPAVITRLTYPANEFEFTTPRLDRYQTDINASSVHNMLSDLDENGIQKSLNTFYNETTQLRTNGGLHNVGKDSRLLTPILEQWKRDYQEWLKHDNNRQLALQEMQQAKQDWGMRDLSYEKIQSLFWEAELGSWKDPVRSVLSVRGTEDDQLWAFHLLRFALISQPAFAAENLAESKARILNSENPPTILSDQIKCIFSLNGPDWTAVYDLVYGNEEGQPAIQASLLVRQRNLNQDERQEQRILGVRFSPLAEGIQEVEESLRPSPPDAAAGVFPEANA